MSEKNLRAVTEADITAALRSASFPNWPQDEGEILEVVNIVIHELTADPVPTGAAGDPYRFLSRVR